MPAIPKLRMRERMRARAGEARMGVLWAFRTLSRLPGLRGPYQKLLIRLIKRTGLFDGAYYLGINIDVANAGIRPLRHYMMFGDREGRCPMPFFDPTYYRSHAVGRTKHVNSLLHYVYVGRHRRISPSPWFDVDYYLRNNKDIARSGRDPLLHFAKLGGLEGRSPTASFDSAYYLQANPEVRNMRINPLAHYLLHGRLEGRPACPYENKDARIASQNSPFLLPDGVSWALLDSRSDGAGLKVDVIVPVYRDRELTLRCLYSVLKARCETPFELIVVDDDSPEPELSADLKYLAERNLFTLLHNDSNRGFVFTVNRGIALHPERDVILLNSDTEVYDNWLDRLISAAKRNPKAATVTPLSNNATICSYPRFLHDNPYPLEIDYGTLDQLTAKVNAAFTVEAPTGVGFCLFLRRDALNELGLFDEGAFGKGYGEENDFCQRAVARGWRNIIAADTFVLHLGGASFQGEKAKRVASAMKVLQKRYPDYGRSVDEFVRRDPLSAARIRLDWARLKLQARKENILITCHNRGGGAERHVQEDTERFLRQGYGVFYLRPERGKPTHVRLGQPACRQLVNQRAVRLADTEILTDALRELRITRIHSHGLVDFTADAPKHLLALARAMKVPLHVDVHDYKVICPRINLADDNGRYCAEPSETACNDCLSNLGNDFGVSNIREWREMHRKVLMEAEAIWVPDQDVADRLARYYPEITCQVTPHDDITSGVITPRIPQVNPGEPLRIAVVGGISKIKGYDVLLRCARQARTRRLPIEFVLLGYSANDRLLEQAGVKITGRYLEQEAEEKLHALQPHVVWFPATWPETYSYTLSLALKCGYPIFAFDLGAIARRLRESELNAGLLPLSLADTPSVINRVFAKYRAAQLHIRQKQEAPHEIT